MAKIVVLAGGDDATAVSAALDGASIDYELVDPTPANILHIVIGMVDDGDDKKKKDKEDKEPKEDKPPKDEVPPAEEAPDDSDIASDASAVEEALAGAKVDGEAVKAVWTKTKAGLAENSILYVPSMTYGPKTTYSINESTFSFWPANAESPMQRVVVERNNHRAVVEIAVKQGTSGSAYLAVGADLADLFKTK